MFEIVDSLVKESYFLLVVFVVIGDNGGGVFDSAVFTDLNCLFIDDVLKVGNLSIQLSNLVFVLSNYSVVVCSVIIDYNWGGRSLNNSLLFRDHVHSLVESIQLLSERVSLVKPRVSIS